MKLRIGDLLIVAVVLILAVAIWVFPAVNKKEGSIVCIEQDGKTIKSILLSEDAIVPIDDMVIEISGGKVSVKETNCPDRVCEKTGEISQAGEAIICVPNKVIVKVVGEHEVDVVIG